MTKKKVAGKETGKPPFNPVPPASSRFKKGCSGNPGGKPALPKEILQARRLNPIMFERLANEYIHKTEIQLKEIARDPSSNMLQVMLANIILKASRDADVTRLTFLLDRLIGKVKEPMGTVNMINFNELPKAQVIAMGLQAIKFLEGKATSEQVIDAE